MHLIVLAVPGCPNVNLLEQRLAQALKRRDVTVSRYVISDQDEAARYGMHGSPAVLIDGIDPFAGPGLPASVSCRLYRDRRGRAEGAPSVRQLRHAISDPVTIVADTDSGGWLDALGRGGRGRIAPAERGLSAVHQAVLRSFAATGRAPEDDVLDEAARPFGTSEVLAELADGDYLCLGQDGQITTAYPFSATATPHIVQISGGAAAYSMCAIDALGIADMVSASVLIKSADPATSEPISVAVDENGAVWDPDTAVVFAGHTAGTCEGPSAAVCCGHMNFFTSHSTAAAWARGHPEIIGGILSQGRALEVGQQAFGQLLH
ncbi:MAG: alkylmercury lyase [Pseudonocardiales bacterium]|nr:MAG: alkylmercury lyase [Pseudonocardiales bacterium]